LSKSFGSPTEDCPIERYSRWAAGCAGFSHGPCSRPGPQRSGARSSRNKSSIMASKAHSPKAFALFPHTESQTRKNIGLRSQRLRRARANERQNIILKIKIGNPPTDTRNKAQTEAPLYTPKRGEGPGVRL
jgi:hypothetical protein